MGHGFTQMRRELLMRWFKLALLAIGICWANALSAPMTMPSTRPAGIVIADVAHASPVDFQGEVLAILESNCLLCESQSKDKAGLALGTPADLCRGGDS